MLQILLSLLLCFLLASPALAQINGARPSGFFPEISSGGDSTASYFTLDASANLTNERLLRFSDNFSTVDNGPGNTYTIDLNTVGITDGGTGATTQQGAVNAILNFSGKATGDMIYFNGTNWVRLPAGSDTQVLTITSGVPTWSSGSVSAPANATYIVQALNASLSAERVATGTANRIVITDGGANGNMTWDIGTDVVTLTGSQTLTNKTLTQPQFTYNASQGMGLKSSGAFTGSLVWADFAGNRTLTIPDPLTNAEFVMTAGNQTIAGTKTFSSAPTLSTGTLNAGANLQTFPSTAQTLVGRTSTDTLTNKTLTAPVFSSSAFTLQQSTANYTIQWNNPAAGRIYTIRDVATDAHFALTNTAMTYSNGGAVYIGSGVMNATAAGTSGQPLLSGGTGAPSFNTLGATAGGTGQTTWTTGDTLYASATNTLAKRGIGATGTIYTVSGGVPIWATAATLGLQTSADSTAVGGRLSVSSTDPCASGTNTSISYVPLTGNTIALYNGSAWQTCTFSAITQSVAALTANTNYDVFVYDANSDGVAETLDLVAWSTGTSRATALAQQNGIYVKSGATGRRFVGTIRIANNVSTRTVWDEDPTGAYPGWRFVCNYYNTIQRHNVYTPSATSWSYNTATARPWNNTMQAIEYVKTGLSSDAPVIGISNLFASGTGQAFNTFAATAASFDIVDAIHSGSGAGDYGAMTAQILLKPVGYFTITPSENTNGSNMSFYTYTGSGGTAKAAFTTFQ